MTNITRYFKLNRRGESQAHVVYAVTFTIIAVVALVGLIMVNTSADDSGQSTTISNATPSAGTPTVFTSVSASNPTTLTVNEGSRYTAYVQGTASDDNGCVDIDGTSQYTISFFRTNSTGNTDGLACDASNETDDHTCVVGATANLTLGSCSGTNTTITYSQTFPLSYITDPTEDTTGVTYSTTDWTARVKVVDDTAAAATAFDTVEVSLLRALDVGSSTDFGTLAVGATSSSQAITVTNTGNMSIDYTVGYNQGFSCTIGSFDGGNVHVTRGGSTSNGSATAMPAQTSPQSINASVAVATTMATSSTSPLYAYLTVPANSGVSGSCSNTAAYTASTDAGSGI